jgi:hypothetical protein
VGGLPSHVRDGGARPERAEQGGVVALRKGRGRPLSYATFESQLRALSHRVGVSVTAHMFRHALAQAPVHPAGLNVARRGSATRT